MEHRKISIFESLLGWYARWLMNIEHDQALEKISDEQLPPNPNEFDITCSSSAFRYESKVLNPLP